VTTLTATHPMAKREPVSAETVRRLVVWASVGVMIVLPTCLTALVMSRG
jgi:hypothetical protein